VKSIRSWTKSQWDTLTQAPTLYVYTIVIAGSSSTKALLTSFFHWLPFCPHKICLCWCPNTSWCCPYTLWILLWRFWGFYLVFIASPKVHNIGSKTCLAIIHLSWEEDGWSQRKKRSKQSFCTACNNTYLHMHI
jgi:hypothetical protein